MWPFSRSRKPERPRGKGAARREEAERAYVRHPALRLRRSGEQGFLEAPDGKALELNATACWIWEQLQSETTLDGLVARLMQEYRIDDVSARRDMAECLERWSGSGLLLKLSPQEKAALTEAVDILESRLGVEHVGRVDLIPGHLAVTIFERTWPENGDTAAGWLFTTTGLDRLEQQEVAFLVRKRPGESRDGYPAVILRTLADIHYMVMNGLRLVAGDYVGITAAPEETSGVWWGGLLFFEEGFLQPVGLATPHLAVMPARSEEFKALRGVGISRLMHRLADTQGRFPPLPLADRDRGPLISEFELTDSLLGAATSIGYPGVTVHMTSSDAVTVELNRDFAAWFNSQRDALSEPGPLVLLSGPDRHCDGYLSWGRDDRGGRPAPEADQPHRRVSVSFLAIVPGAEDEGGRILEDGVVFTLSGSSWHGVMDRLCRGAPIGVLETGEGLTLRVVWLGAA